jgi:hypothetical protein
MGSAQQMIALHSVVVARHITLDRQLKISMTSTAKYTHLYLGSWLNCSQLSLTQKLPTLGVVRLA